VGRPTALLKRADGQIRALSIQTEGGEVGFTEKKERENFLRGLTLLEGTKTILKLIPDTPK